MSRPGRDATAAWRKAKATVKARDTICAVCGRALNHDLPKTSPWSTHVDHVVPIAYGGAPLDVTNLRALHARCNLRRPNPANDRRKRGTTPWRSRNW